VQQKSAISAIDRPILDPVAKEPSGSKYRIGRTPPISKNVRNAKGLFRKLRAAII
jgi:hypothetical protein